MIKTRVINADLHPFLSITNQTKQENERTSQFQITSNIYVVLEGVGIPLWLVIPL